MFIIVKVAGKTMIKYQSNSLKGIKNRGAGFQGSFDLA